MLIKFIEMKTPEATAIKLKYNIDVNDINLHLAQDDWLSCIKQDVAHIRFDINTIKDTEFMYMLHYIEHASICLQIYTRPIYFEKSGRVCYNVYTDDTTGIDILELEFPVQIYIGVDNE